MICHRRVRLPLLDHKYRDHWESETSPEEPDEMSPKRTSTSETPTMTQAAIRQLIVDEGAVGLIRWFERIELVFSRSECVEEDRKILGISSLMPKHGAKHREAYGSLYRGITWSIEGNVTASKPQTLEEAITITQRLMEQVIKHNFAQETNDHKQKFEDRRNTTDNNNYPNDRNNNNHSNNHNNDNYQNNHNNHNRNNDYHHQQNERQETIRTYAATPIENKRYTENKRYHGNLPLCYNVLPMQEHTGVYALLSVRLATKWVI
ncbi:hypothetical protein Tco_0639770 [Tanacetum coccineum]